MLYQGWWVRKSEQENGTKTKNITAGGSRAGKVGKGGRKTARMVLNKSGVGVSLRTVQRVLQNRATKSLAISRAAHFSVRTT